MLQFGMKPPFTYSDFLEKCGLELGKEDRDILKRASMKPSEDAEDKLPLLEEWKTFDRNLRNELVKIRADKKGKDQAGYLRGSAGFDPFIAPLAHWAMNQDSPMDGELYLDKVRWEKMEEIKTGHYFDIEYLTVYCLQLQILERWNRINSGDGMKALERMAGKILAHPE